MDIVTAANPAASLVRPPLTAAYAAPAADAGDGVFWDEVVPPGACWTHLLRRGDHLRITDLDGRGSFGMLLYRNDERSERYNQPDTTKVQNQVYLTTGTVLFSDVGKAMAAIVADTAGAHDTLGGCSDRVGDRARWGDGGGDFGTDRNSAARNGHDTFLIGLLRHGLDERDLVPNVTFFAGVRVADGGGLEWTLGATHPGAEVTLRAEMDLLVVCANTPHPLDPAPAYAPGRIRLRISHGDPAATDDPIRNRCPEVARAYDNTEALYR